MPPTEKRGRIHTSTVIVSVTDPNYVPDQKYTSRKNSDFKIEWFSGSGKGGQHRNKHQNSCRIVHIPTGIKQEKQGKNRESNKKFAMKILNETLDSMMQGDQHKNFSIEKRSQVGSGMRGDKFRTYRFQDDQVVDHRTGKKARCSKIMKGHFDLLH